MGESNGGAVPELTLPAVESREPHRHSALQHRPRIGARKPSHLEPATRVPAVEVEEFLGARSKGSMRSGPRASGLHDGTRRERLHLACIRGPQDARELPLVVLRGVDPLTLSVVTVRCSHGHAPVHRCAHAPRGRRVDPGAVEPRLRRRSERPGPRSARCPHDPLGRDEIEIEASPQIVGEV